MFLQSSKMKKLNLYLSKDNIKNILLELGKHKIIEFQNLNKLNKKENLPFQKELIFYEKKRNKIEIFYNEMEKNFVDKLDVNVDIESVNFVGQESEGISLQLINHKDKDNIGRYNDSNNIGNKENININDNLKENVQDNYIEKDNVQDNNIDIKENNINIKKEKENKNIFLYVKKDVKTDLDDLENSFARLQELKLMRSNIKNKLRELRENLQIIQFLSENNLKKKNTISTFIAGIINNSKLLILKKMLEICLRNNLLILNEQIDSNSVFILFTYGTCEKMRKICTSFGARIYDLDGIGEEGGKEEEGEGEEGDANDKDQEEEEDSNSINNSINNIDIDKEKDLKENKNIKEENYLIELNQFLENTSTDQNDKDENEKEKEKDQDILKNTSLIQEYEYLAKTNKNTILAELKEIKYKIKIWELIININLIIYRNMNKMRFNNCFIAEAFIPEERFGFFKKMVAKICDVHGRIGYEDGEGVLITGHRGSGSAMDEIGGIDREGGSVRDEIERDKEGDSALYGTRNEIDENKNNKEEENFNDKINISNRTIEKGNENLKIINNDSSLSNSLEELRIAQQQENENEKNENLIPPTYFKVNDFTRPFQDMNDVYGVPTYREVNPSLFTCITFPLLFGSMFGDVGHGIFLIIISLLLIKYREKASKLHEMMELIVSSRYIILMCGIFSIYFGFIYSEFFGVPIHTFYNNSNNLIWFGVNPYFHKSVNMNVMNNVKMKLSILIGTIHMLIGLLINTYNCYLQNRKDIFICRTLPKIFSFLSFNGYLFLLIIIKFISPFNQSIINTIVNMFTDPFKNEYFYYGQKYVQLFLLSIFIICIPWMLLSYPIYKKEKNMEICIHIGIETIEFNLGLISNISSYLRIWAVSLAHSQLTNILHMYSIGSKNVLVRIFTFPLWFVCTFLLMICLEGLSSALHAMRLNWIEFNSKFYDGQGRKFKALQLEDIDEDLDDES